MGKTYSYSQINGFSNCPRKYKFQYIEKAEVEKPVSVELFLGSAIHKILENIYQLKIDGITPKLEDLLKDYYEYWDGPDREHIKVTREHMSVEDYIENGAKMLKQYYENYTPFDESQVLALEKNISFALDDNERYVIRSRIDRISQRKSDGVIEIVDYKTDRTIPAQAILDRDEQLGLYNIGVKKLWPQFDKVESKKIFLRQGIEMSTAMDEDMLEELRYQAFQKVIEIENAIREDNFPPKESIFCDWCIYAQLCPAKRHKLALDEEITDDFDAKGGKEMAEKYLDLNRKKKLIESEMSAIKTDLVTYCEQADLTKIEADHGSLSVKVIESEQFPSKTRSEGDYLKMTILARDAGLDECFKLDQNVLYKEFYKKAALPEELAEKFKQFLIVMKSSRITTKYNQQ